MAEWKKAAKTPAGWKQTVQYLMASYESCPKGGRVSSCRNLRMQQVRNFLFSLLLTSLLMADVQFCLRTGANLPDMWALSDTLSTGTSLIVELN